MNNDDQTRMQLVEHLAELLGHIRVICVWPLVFALIGRLFYPYSRSFAAFLEVEWSMAPPSTTERLLWGAMVAVPVFNTVVLRQLYAFAAPGLYRRERRMAVPPMIWALACPLLSVLALKAYALLCRSLALPKLSTIAEARTWGVRLYLILLLCTLAFSLPRQVRRASTSIVFVVSAILCLVPHHVFDTLLLLGLELSLVAFLASFYVEWLFVHVARR